MVESTLTAMGRVTKKAVMGALKGTGEKAQAAAQEVTQGTLDQETRELGRYRAFFGQVP